MEKPTYDVRVWRVSRWWKPWAFSYRLHMPGAAATPFKGPEHHEPMGRVWTKEGAYLAAESQAVREAMKWAATAEYEEKRGLSACPAHPDPDEAGGRGPCTCVPS